ncbi:MAG TPA: sulfatase/phosphatase domain-containing protein, partial [Bryobacteraceae bacterium]|nr:sulfatase/phosphatase domain-containing protein [Bryobacteraceae bacterium]
DVYPTLCDLAGVPQRDELEGVSLRPLLTNPAATWDRPVVTTYFKDNHAVRSERWRYIHYSDGGEELYDELADPQEWTNLAARPEYAPIKQELSRWLPSVNAPESVHERGASFEN